MRLFISGCTGRMGKELVKAILSSEKHELAGALARNTSPMIGKDVAELFNEHPTRINITNNISTINDIDAVIDFTRPNFTMELASYCHKNKIPHIIGTTGFPDKQIRILEEYSKDNKIFLSYNMSLGINLLASLIEKAASILNDEYDAEIYEMHHRNKVDAPSGTALMLGKSVAKGRNIEFKDENLIFNRREINNKREKGKIGFASLRGGAVIGDHKVIFAGDDEIIEFNHRAINRSIFAKGAIKAAEWLINQPNGIYNMDNMFCN